MSYTFKPATVELYQLPDPPPGLIIINEIDLISQVFAAIHMRNTTTEEAITHKQKLFAAAYDNSGRAFWDSPGDIPIRPGPGRIWVNLVERLVDYMPERVLSAAVVGLAADPETSSTRVAQVGVGAGYTSESWHAPYEEDFKRSKLGAAVWTIPKRDRTLRRIAVNLLFAGQTEPHTVAQLIVSQSLRTNPYS